MKIVKKMIKDRKVDRNAAGDRNREGTLILSVDEVTHTLMSKNGKVNIGWRKYYIINYISVKRCFKCWGFYHIAGTCTRPVTCHKCAGEHKESECKSEKKNVLIVCIKIECSI